MKLRAKNKLERSRYLLGIVWARTWVSRGPNYWILDELHHMTDAYWDKLTEATRGSLKYGFGASTAYIKPSSAGPEEPWVKLGEVASATFAEALLNPSEPNDAAKEAAKWYLELLAENSL
jgi:hypothetical protein